MDCPEVGELIPWYVNRTLDTSLELGLKEHLANCAACRQELDETRTALAVFDAHLSSADLVELAWDRPVPGLAAGLAERHLADCAACRGDLELARASRRLEPTGVPPRRARIGFGRPATLAATGLLAFGVGALWQASRSQERVTTLEGGRLESERRATELEGRLQRQHEATAALEDRLAELSAPQANLAVVEIFGASQVERSSGERLNEVRLSGDARFVALVVTPPAGRRGTASADLVEAGGALVWHGDGLRPGALGAYTLGLPANMLHEGRFELVLRWPLGAESYRLLVRRAP